MAVMEAALGSSLSHPNILQVLLTGYWLQDSVLSRSWPAEQYHSQS